MSVSIVATRRVGRLSILLAFVSFALHLSASPVRAAELTLQQTAELYYRAWLNHDRASGVRLNKALRGETDGRDIVDMRMLNDPMAWRLKRMETLRVKSDPSAPEVKRLMARFMVDSARRVRCRAVGERIGSQPAGDRFHATVTLACSLPDAVAGLAQVREREKGANMNDPSPRLLKAVIEAFEKAPLTRNVSTEMDLTAGLEKQRWRPDISHTGVDQVTRALAGQITEAGLGR